MRALNEAEEESTVPLTPLIDVVFLLIIFFLVGTTFYRLEKDVAIRLPTAAGGRTPQAETPRLEVNVRADGEVVVSGRTVSPDELARELRLAAERDPGLVVVIRGDRLARHQDIVRVLGECLILGITEVDIAVFPAPEPLTPPAPARQGD